MESAATLLQKKLTICIHIYEQLRQWYNISDNEFKDKPQIEISSINKQLRKNVSTHKSKLKWLLCISDEKDRKNVVNHKCYT